MNLAHIISRFGMENGVVRYVAHYRTQGDTSRVRGTIIQAILVLFRREHNPLVGHVLRRGLYGRLVLQETDNGDGAARLRRYAAVLYVHDDGPVGDPGFPDGYLRRLRAADDTARSLPLTPARFLHRRSRFGRCDRGLRDLYAAGVRGRGLLFTQALYADPRPEGGAEVRDEGTFLRFYPHVHHDRFAVPQHVVGDLGSGLLRGRGAGWNLSGRRPDRDALDHRALRLLSGIFSPIISSLHAQGDRERLGVLYKDIARWIFTGAFGIFLAILLLAEDVLVLGFGERAATGALALVVVAFAQLFSASVGPTPRMLAMTDNQNVVMVATAAAALTGLAVSIALVWSAPTTEQKILGAAIGMASGIVTENTATLLAVRRRLGFWPYNLAWIKPLAAGLIAAAVAYGVALVLSLPAILALAVVGGVFGICYLALLLLFGLNETDKEFLQAFWDVAQRQLRRGRN